MTSTLDSGAGVPKSFKAQVKPGASAILDTPAMDIPGGWGEKPPKPRSIGEDMSSAVATAGGAISSFGRAASKMLPAGVRSTMSRYTNGVIAADATENQNSSVNETTEKSASPVDEPSNTVESTALESPHRAMSSSETLPREFRPMPRPDNGTNIETPGNANAPAVPPKESSPDSASAAPKPIIPNDKSTVPKTIGTDKDVLQAAHVSRNDSDVIQEFGTLADKYVTSNDGTTSSPVTQVKTKPRLSDSPAMHGAEPSSSTSSYPPTHESASGASTTEDKTAKSKSNSKKVSFWRKLRGELKMVRGKISKNDAKIREGQALKAGGILAGH